MYRRIVWIVLDSVGIGEMPVAAEYGDAGSNTLGNLSRVRPMRLPYLQRLGLGNIRPIENLPPVTSPGAAFGRCALASPGKDTTTGHWEMAGIHLIRPFPLYPNGFPQRLMREFEAQIGRGWLGNVAASGTEIIARLGDEHVRTGKPIVYTSADSVFQVAAHESIIPLEQLYRICEIARDLLRGEHEVGRVIARPFTGTSGAYTRTPDRKDYAVSPPQGMLLDRLAGAGVAVHGIGKIGDIYLGRGISSSEKTKSNADGMARIREAVNRGIDGLIFANLVDFDSQFGHRNDVEGYARALEEVDAWLPQLEGEEAVIVCADHGCDPTTPSTDHSREYVPLIAFGRGVRAGVNLGTRWTLSDIGQTVAENFGLRIEQGRSFLCEMGQ
jgi:phosphopentomutase